MLARLDRFLLKGMFYLTARFNKVDSSTGEVESTVTIRIASCAADLIGDVNEWVERHATYLVSNLNKFNERDSGLVFDGIEKVDIKINLLENLQGSGCFTLPKALADKKAVINVECQSQCFKYAVLSILHYNDI